MAGRQSTAGLVQEPMKYSLTGLRGRAKDAAAAGGAAVLVGATFASAGAHPLCPVQECPRYDWLTVNLVQVSHRPVTAPHRSPQRPLTLRGGRCGR
eukprot:2233212-Pyramimonas_sp.AAC.1